MDNNIYNFIYNILFNIFEIFGILLMVDCLIILTIFFFKIL